MKSMPDSSKLPRRLALSIKYPSATDPDDLGVNWMETKRLSESLGVTGLLTMAGRCQLALSW